MAKSVGKSIRLTPELFEYIEAHPGNGFNEKFENIILEAKNTEAERLQHLEQLDREIKEKKDQLTKMSTELRDFVSQYISKYYHLTYH